MTSWQKLVMITQSNTKSTPCCDVGALFLEPTYWQGMQRSYEMYSNRTWPFCQSNCTPVSPGHRNDKSNLFLPNHRCKWRSFARVDLRAAMFSFPLCVAVDSSGRLFHVEICRETTQATSMSRTMRETSWDVEQTRNRLAFLAKTAVQT